MTAMQDVFTDLVAEGDDIDRLVADADPGKWAAQTPSPGWTVGHQVAHLAFIAHLARLAASDTAGFQVLAAQAQANFQGAVDRALAEYLADPPAAVLERWREERAGAAKELAATAPDKVVPWLVNPLPPSILAAAGIMELFGHGQDIADALGVRREYTDRIGHLAWFATRTRDFGYLARGLQPPTAEFRYELTAPSGVRWEFGPADAEERVSGSAADFCLLVTRRRHRDDLDLTAVGTEADRWLDIAQAYRGPAGAGRTPGQFPRR
jgi:uncharacterized protein (TIGR03084 family)